MVLEHENLNLHIKTSFNENGVFDTQPFSETVHLA